jgi:Family of unknown function (DUF6353)
VTIIELIDKGKQLVSDNSTALLTGIGVTGTVTTAVLTGRASFKAARIIDAETKALKDDEPELTNKDKVKLVWTHYIPAVGVGTVTISSVILANRLSSKQAAALAAAYGLSEKAFQEYKEKVVEKIGQNKETDIRDSIAQDRVRNNPVNSREIILAGTGEVLCFDILTGRYFQSSVEEIKRAENKMNFEIVHHMYVSLSAFYQEIGLPPTGFSEELGWNVDNRCEVKFSTVMSSDDRPCVAIDFHYLPIQNYGRFY